ncbi:hypothetical protein COL8621_00845 [Actibacterium lipolyticum]|uniref:Uncharacterized protein n=1 Tax=Actibacterium lipolyticum TaxID=1524263 RepID=A0A238JPU9_9RHOB|nr:hypothetical protein COL8621_00845 [Actibacterium lipolyticum]
MTNMTANIGAAHHKKPEKGLFSLAFSLLGLTKPRHKLDDRDQTKRPSFRVLPDQRPAKSPKRAWDVPVGWKSE